MLNTFYAGNVRVTAAHDVPVAGAGHRITVFGVVDDENAPPCELEPSIDAVIVEHSIAFPRPAGERDSIPKGLTVNPMHGQTDAHCLAQRLRTDDIAAMDHRSRPFGRRTSHRRRQRIRAVVTVRP